MQLTVTNEEQGQRLDKYLAIHLPELTRQRIQCLIKDTHIHCDAKSLTPSSKTKEGDTYFVTIPDLTLPDAQAEAIPLDIVYEDDDLLVVNKPAGMVVHPAAGICSGTLVNALLHHCGDSLSGIGGVSRPGIVHRLDKDTSGLMVVAKHDKAHQHLSAQLQSRTMSRTYHAFIWSMLQPPQGTIDTLIGRSPVNRKKMAVVTSGGKSAITHYKTIERLIHPSSGQIIGGICECRLQTGRTHQIRVHLTHQGCPIIGDPTYGMSIKQRLHSVTSLLTQDELTWLGEFRRQALHAVALRFAHPVTGESLELHCSYPDDLMRLKATLWKT